MRRKGYRVAALLFLIVAIPSFFMFHSPAPPANAAVGDLYLELAPSPLAPGVLSFGVAGPAIPPTGSMWHELYPAFCTMQPQEGYGDNGDGVVSVCDAIQWGGVVYHIDWVGPTYHLMAVGTSADTYWEPADPTHNPGNPVCESWQEVHPEFGMLHHIDDWQDANGTGVVDACDMIASGGVLYHVEEVSLNIRVTPGGTPTEKSTWGKIKSHLWPF
jgi:hypothetical protein